MFDQLTATLPTGVGFRAVLHPNGTYCHSYFSPSLQRILGLTDKEYEEPVSLAKYGSWLLWPTARHRQKLIRESARTLLPYTTELQVRNQLDGTVRWLRITAHPHREDDGSVVWDGVGCEITDLKKAIEERDLLLHELHHRVKNSFQMVWGLLQLEFVMTSDPNTQEVIGRVMDRIMPLSQVHQQLYRQHSFETVELGGYLRNLLEGLHGIIETRGITLDVRTATVKVPFERAATFGLIVNELVTNAVKHAFPDAARPGRIALTVTKDRRKLTLTVADDGQGITPQQVAASSSYQIVAALVEQLDGVHAVTGDGGTVVVLTTPIQKI